MPARAALEALADHLLLIADTPPPVNLRAGTPLRNSGADSHDNLRATHGTSLHYQVFFPGAGHTRDNLVVSSEGVLVCGYLLESVISSDFGIVADAVLADWASSARPVARNILHVRSWFLATARSEATQSGTDGVA